MAPSVLRLFENLNNNSADEGTQKRSLVGEGKTEASGGKYQQYLCSCISCIAKGSIVDNGRAGPGVSCAVRFRFNPTAYYLLPLFVLLGQVVSAGDGRTATRVPCGDVLVSRPMPSPK